MKFRLLAFGKAPMWVTEGVQQYAKRMPHLQVEQVALNPVKSRKQRMFDQCGEQAIRVVLDKSGKTYSSESLAAQCRSWQRGGRDICFLIGDDNGFNKQDMEKADLIWSLSTLTFPYLLTRVIVCEQLYRAHSIISGHNYHRS